MLLEQGEVIFQQLRACDRESLALAGTSSHDGSMKRLSRCLVLSLFLAGCGSSSDEGADGSGGSGGEGGASGAGGSPGSGGAGSGGESASGGSSSTGGSSSLCALPFEPGFCNALFPVYTYDAKAGECTEANYGGCGGNENRFDTKQECEAACGDSTASQVCGDASDCDACLTMDGCSWTADLCASECLQDAACFGAGNIAAPTCPG